MFYGGNTGAHKIRGLENVTVSECSLVPQDGC